ncbi:MAG: bifunctional (p)ppGpp synthetase/guanosine-3',5'-bis(diphosphate) 3'-pyrophosphohydrolase [SAR202 cluster bacterium]|nr:bifunctional (p)ppGpp synthetase/guanosine-3',5'-bis(diphosphate) 3'-pyrophosphohydrolase [SAR202 cluster bacterium]
MAVELADLLERARTYLSEDRLLLVEQAYEFAAAQHDGQLRMSGEPYIEHPLNAALYLADLKQDSATLAATLLHDVIEDCDLSKEELEERFGAEVSRLVDGVTKLTRIDLISEGRLDEEISDSHAQAESVRKMLVAMAEDVRVVVIKLADRLHNMRTLGALPLKRRRAVAQETLDIYSPLAHRLGMWDIKWQLEDLAFRAINPVEYKDISRRLATRRVEREAYLERQCQSLRETLEAAGITADLNGRPKSIYSIHRKIQKYSAQGKEYDEIYDLYAIRVLVDTNADCYNTLGVVHQLWHPVPGQFDDYIATPKENMYQSLHTTVMCEGGIPLEVQVRTFEMHNLAEYGVAAHWTYKEGRSKDGQFEEKMAWLRQLLEWQREVAGTDEFLESVKTDIFRDQVFVYTPKGEIRELPSGSTPIDFAYHIHTDLGHRCIGAKVNGRLMPLDTVLQNGDTVEVVTSKVARGPSMDWLNSALGYVNTASAHQKIRQWFHKLERSAHMEQGHELLTKTLRRLPRHITESDAMKALKFDTVDDLYIALGSGNLSAAQLENRLSPQVEDAPAPATYHTQPPESPTTGIQVLGVGDLLTRTARCCNPVPGDEIIGYITRIRGITVHRTTCPNVINEDEKERLVAVSWGPSQDLHPVRVEITSWDRVGLLRDITTMVSGEKVNIAGVVTAEPGDGTAVITLTLYTTGVSQLSRLFSRLDGIKGVLNVNRTAAGTTPSTNP